MTRRDFLKGSGAAVLMGLAPGIVKAMPGSVMTATEVISKQVIANHRQSLTLLELARRMEIEGSLTLAEALTEANPILQDIPWKATTR